MIVDYSRRTDPACKQGLDLFRKKLKTSKLPDLIEFWTKNPSRLAHLYHKDIKELQSKGVIICAQVTMNNYQPPMETVPLADIKELKELIGYQNIRLRFDPIIIGYTTLSHYKKTLQHAIYHGIKHITINFLNPSYQGIGNILKANGYEVKNPNDDYKIKVVNSLLDITPKDITIAVCADNARLSKQIQRLRHASCADPIWFEELGLDLTKIQGHSSRKGCGCFYTDDWGLYPSKGGYKCKHQCLYCYAKHSI